MKQIATNAPNGIAFTITTHLNQTGAINLVSGGGHYPSTGVIEITDETDSDKSDKRRVSDLTVHGLCKGEGIIFPRAEQDMALSGNTCNI